MEKELFFNLICQIVQNSIETIDLSHTKITHEQLSQLLEVLKKNKSVQTLHLLIPANKLMDQSFEKIAEMLQINTSLKAFYVRNVENISDQFRLTHQFPARDGLPATRVRLDRSRAPAISHIIFALKDNNTLTTLDMRHMNLFHYPGLLREFMLILENHPSLENVMINGCDISQEYNWEKHKTLEMAHNNIKMLSRIISSSQKLIRLELSGIVRNRPVSYDSNAIVFEIFKSLSVNSTLQYLDFSNNRLGNNDLLLLTDYLNKNRGLRYLDLSGNYAFTAGGIDRFIELIIQHPTLNTIKLCTFPKLNYIEENLADFTVEDIHVKEQAFKDAEDRFNFNRSSSILGHFDEIDKHVKNFDITNVILNYLELDQNLFNYNALKDFINQNRVLSDLPDDSSLSPLIFSNKVTKKSERRINRRIENYPLLENENAQSDNAGEQNHHLISTLLNTFSRWMCC